MTKKRKTLSPEWKRYKSAVREIQNLIDSNHRPWWKRVLLALKIRS